MLMIRPPEVSWFEPGWPGADVISGGPADNDGQSPERKIDIQFRAVGLEPV